MAEASAMTLLAGTDMSCGGEHRRNLLKAVKEGLISEDVIDRALIRAFTSRFRLGLFDSPESVPYCSIGKEAICDDAKKALAVDMANDSIVLLKNDKKLLPLKTEGVKQILVVGPNAKFRQLGGYSAGGMSKVVDTVVNVMALDGIRNAVKDSGVEVIYEKGWCSDKEFRKGGIFEALPGTDMEEVIADFLPENVSREQVGQAMMAKERHAVEDPDYQADNGMLWDRALKAGSKADVVVIIAGTDDVTASEEHDRETLELPYGQNEKIKQMLEVNPNTVVVLTTLGMVTGDFMDVSHTLINAHFAGQEQGTAIANVLFGKVNPNAKLTATWYKRMEDLPHVNDYGLKKQDTYDNKSRTYMYFDGEVRFPFGYGLSYTSYEYSNIKLSKSSLDANDTLEVSVDVTNTGAMAGKEIVELYIRKITPEKMYSNKPKRQLKGFAKVSLNPGETKTVVITVPLSEVTFWSNMHHKMMVEQGDYVVEVGGSSDNLPCSAEFSVSGRWNAKLYNVYAVSDKYIFSPGQQGTLKVSAALEDTTHLCMRKYAPVFTSSDQEVASVDEFGKITANSVGAASITATVTYEGVSKSYTVPVVVKA
jgi:beta-glucosidase